MNTSPMVPDDNIPTGDQIFADGSGASAPGEPSPLKRGGGKDMQRRSRVPEPDRDDDPPVPRPAKLSGGRDRLKKRDNTSLAAKTGKAGAGKKKASPAGGATKIAGARDRQKKKAKPVAKNPGPTGAQAKSKKLSVQIPIYKRPGLRDAKRRRMG